MKCNDKRFSLLVIVILLIMLVINILTFSKKDSARDLEVVKVGGEENMKAVQELYKTESYIAQQTAAIDQALAQIGVNIGEENNIEVEENTDEILEDNTNEEEDVVENGEKKKNNELISKLEEIKASTPIHGDENARFTILEYSELLCPYCKRHSEQGTINAVLEKYPDEVNAVFRNFIVHAPAAKLAEVVECVGELSSEDYFKFIENSFASSETMNVENLIDIAEDMGIKGKSLEKCVEEGRYADDINAQTNEGRTLFGVAGTPGNVIIDKETGEFVLIPGAYPVEKFVEEIEKLKN